jgi:hypothetical protein
MDLLLSRSPAPAAAPPCALAGTTVPHLFDSGWLLSDGVMAVLTPSSTPTSSGGPPTKLSKEKPPVGQQRSKARGYTPQRRGPSLPLTQHLPKQPVPCWHGRFGERKPAPRARKLQTNRARQQRRHLHQPAVHKGFALENTRTDGTTGADPALLSRMDPMRETVPFRLTCGCEVRQKAGNVVQEHRGCA